MKTDSFHRARRLAALLGLMALLCGCWKRNSAPAFETAPVKRGDIVQLVTATGQLSAVVSVDVGSQISGAVQKIYVDFNSMVKKDQVVAEIDPAIYLAAVHQAEGDLASAKAARELDRLTAKRKQDLVSQHAATQADLDKAVADLGQAEANVIIKQAALERAQADLGHCRILAPVDGIVIARKVDVGQTVAAEMTTPVLFTIAQDITKMHIDADVSEADIGQVALGQGVDFTVDAFPDEVFHGTVAQVRKSPTTVDNVVTYDTVIAVDNPEQKLFPGMTANVSILVAERKQVLTIPNAALRFAPPEKTKYENTLALTTVLPPSRRLIYQPSRDGTALKVVDVRIGITNGADTEVAEGLAEGDRVVTAAAPGKSEVDFGRPPP